MGNPSPVVVPSDLSNIKTVPELVRFLSACLKDLTSQFNTLLSNKEIYGSIGTSGTIGFTGSGNYGVSLIGTGSYYVSFREAFKLTPAVYVTPHIGSALVIANVTPATTGFLATIQNTSTVLVNSNFSFLVKGTK